MKLSIPKLTSEMLLVPTAMSASRKVMENSDGGRRRFRGGLRPIRKSCLKRLLCRWLRDLLSAVHIYSTVGQRQPAVVPSYGEAMCADCVLHLFTRAAPIAAKWTCN